jgi:hypothetical protein
MRAGVHKYRIMLSLSLVGFCLAGKPLAAQSQTCSTVGGADPDNWRRTPARAHAHPDTVDPATRAVRDGYWSRIVPPYNSGRPAVAAPSGGAKIEGEQYTNPPAGVAVATPDLFWVEGIFAGADVYETSTGSLYTEIHLKILRVIGKAGANALATGSTVDVGVIGGCLLSPSGDVHDFASADYRNGMRPGHTYLVQILRYPLGGFYSFRVAVADVTSGVAQPVSRTSADLARLGKWPYAGLTEAAAISQLEREINPAN